ncbi:MAG: hypothetical protein FI737_04315 [SAR202 cluster bacterium]|jgi:hypothetical protein|nr:hypothetical protein [Dehalococcoidia bacterium]MQF88295.1 hypothetical protein [SAR202 cluster bacterium]|tara:strand:+ start:1795 stop:2106 length:312 start_codon:yes stop_codon:yes gene_type:complete
MGDYAYLVMMDIPAELEGDFNRVYNTQHVPNIVKATGVNSCVRYKVESTNNEGMARYAALYDIDSPEVPTSDAWVAESEKGDWPTQIRPHATNRSHTIYKKVG